MNAEKHAEIISLHLHQFDNYKTAGKHFLRLNVHILQCSSEPPGEHAIFLIPRFFLTF